MIMSTIKSPFPSSVSLLFPSSPHPQPLSFPAHRLTLCLFFSEEADLEGVMKIAKEKREDVRTVVVYCGETQPWERFQWMQEEPAVAWLHSSDVPTPLDPISHVSLYLLLGATVLLHYSQLPLCLSLPTLTPVSSLQALADLITQGSTGDLIWAYSQVKARCGDMDQRGLGELLSLLSQMYELKLETALQAFEMCKWGADPEDIVNLQDVSFKQFLRRLKNYCLGKEKEVDWKREAETLRSVLEAEHAKIAMMARELEEKDNVIVELRRRFEEGQTSITQSRLRKSPSGKNHPSSFALRLEENSPELPEDNGNELDPLPKSPSFKKKLTRRKVLAVKSVLIGELGIPDSWHKAESESPILKPQYPSVEMFTINPLINSRFLGAQARKKSPPKLGRTPRAQPRKPEPEYQPVKQSNRLVFSSNRRTM